MQLPILSGVYGVDESGIARSVPVNLTPIAEPNDGNGTGVSKGYLRIEHGIVTTHTAAGKDRGSYFFEGKHLRVLGSTLYSVAGTLTPLADIGDDGKAVDFAEGFGRLGIASAENLYYLVGSIVTRVTDPDLGKVLSVTWSDGYFLTTDGDYIVATELNDPTSVDPLKYGSSEADPDPITGMLALRGEVYALNRYSIEKFINSPSTSGGAFPFIRSRGSQIPKGCVSAAAFTPFVETFAFCGSARDESAAIYLAGAGQAIKISPRVLDEALAELNEAQLTTVELETVNSAGLYQLLVHLPGESWVYHWSASQLLDVPVWSKLRGGVALDQPWPARHYQQVGTDWYCGTDGKIGRVDVSSPALFGVPYGFRFDTPFVYNESRGAIMHEAELIARGTANVALSYTNDGRTWSQERFCGTKRLAWRRLGRLSSYRGFRFRGVVQGAASFTRLEVQVEALDG